MRTINMGLNQEPSWVIAEDAIARWKEAGNQSMVEFWEKEKARSLELRDEISRIVEEEGCCELNWSCMGETRFNIHANQWKLAMPQYRFEIGRYSCKVYAE